MGGGRARRSEMPGSLTGGTFLWRIRAVMAKVLFTTTGTTAAQRCASVTLVLRALIVLQVSFAGLWRFLRYRLLVVCRQW